MSSKKTAKILLRVLFWVLGIILAFFLVLLAFKITQWDFRGDEEAISVKNRSEDQIKFIQHFNSRSGMNEVGGMMERLDGPEAQLRSSYISDDAVLPKGSSLCLRFRMEPGQRVEWRTGLNALDISRAEAISFFIKAEKKYYTKIFLSLTDTTGKNREVNIADFVEKRFWFHFKPRWEEAVIPVDNFSGVDLNSLQDLGIVIKTGDKMIEGRFSIDSITFIGPKRLFFNSLKDNLYGFPTEIVNPKGKELLKIKDETKFLSEIAADTWKYFENCVDKRTHLPVDYIKVGSENSLIGDYTSPTNIGMYLMSCVSAQEMGFISEEKAVGRIRSCLSTLEHLPRWNGFFYNFYNTTNLQTTNKFVSSVDNGWLAAGLIVVRNAFRGDFYDKVSSFLEEMDFGVFYDPSLGHLRLGYDGKKGEYSRFHYGIFCTEARVASAIAIGKGDVEKEHWFRVYRTLPEDWDWQNQEPKGREKKAFGTPYFSGYYMYDNTRIVPSWGGSMFEFLMPALVLREREYAPFGLGLNNEIATRIHIDYALEKKGYPVWGISPCSTANGKISSYKELGISEIGVKGYRDIGIVTPHATFLALGVAPKEAVKNLRNYLELFKIYGEYGFYDSVDLRKDTVTHQYLALDQGMSLVALCNYLRDGEIRRYFFMDSAGRMSRKLLKAEEFF